MTGAPPIFKFRLYVAGGSQNSARARANLQALCGEHLPGRHDIEIIDVLRDPKRALADDVLLTPMLVKVSPAPVHRMIGTLSQTQPVLDALGLSKGPV